MDAPVRAERAFTLAESVMVAALISLIVIFTVSLVPSFKLSNRRAEMEMQAGALAQTGLERLRSAPFDATTTTTLADVTMDGVTYKSSVREYDVISVGTPPQSISKKVRVTIGWDWSGRKHEAFRETVICRLLRS